MKPFLFALGLSVGFVTSTWAGLGVVSKPPSETETPGQEVRPEVKPGATFRDCDACPEMVVIPAGSFVMGSPITEEDRDFEEGPLREVKIFHSFALGKYEVTFAEWETCVTDGGCIRRSDRGWGRGRRPVINASWGDVQDYVAWLGRKTGEKYRLPTEAEWEYAARAGTTTARHWGEDVGNDKANCHGCSDLDGERTTPVGSFPANAFGLHDMLGNVWEWVEDCWNDTYEGGPVDGSAWTVGDCSQRVLRGGSWGFLPRSARSASRHRSVSDPKYRLSTNGFRLAKSTTP